ncbi:MAG: NUDIX hydrolase, partial [Plesiomonas shigelloides]
KGTAEPDLSLQANAIKEAFEESGLQVEITGFIGDFERTTSVARMYKARRVGGDPTDAGWETQAVSLVPKEHLYRLLNMWPDHPIAESIGAGEAPKKKE